MNHMNIKAHSREWFRDWRFPSEGQTSSSSLKCMLFWRGPWRLPLVLPAWWSRGWRESTWEISMYPLEFGAWATMESGICLVLGSFWWQQDSPQQFIVLEKKSGINSHPPYLSLRVYKRIPQGSTVGGRSPGATKVAPNWWLPHLEKGLKVWNCLQK